MQTFRKRRAGLSATAGLSCYVFFIRLQCWNTISVINLDIQLSSPPSLIIFYFRFCIKKFIGCVCVFHGIGIIRPIQFNKFELPKTCAVDGRYGKVWHIEVSKNRRMCSSKIVNVRNKHLLTWPWPLTFRPTCIRSVDISDVITAITND